MSDEILGNCSTTDHTAMFQSGLPSFPKHSIGAYRLDEAVWRLGDAVEFSRTQVNDAGPRRPSGGRNRGGLAASTASKQQHARFPDETPELGGEALHTVPDQHSPADELSIC